MNESPHRSPLSRVDGALADVAGIALVLMMVLTVGSSVSRFLFAAPIPDVEAICEMLLVGVVMLPFAYLQVQKGHVEVTVFTDAVPPRGKRWLAMLGYLVGAAAFGLLLYALILGAQDAWQFSDAYFGINKIPTWPARTLAAAAILFMTLRLLLDLGSGARDLLRKDQTEKQ